MLVSLGDFLDFFLRKKVETCTTSRRFVSLRSFYFNIPAFFLDAKITKFFFFADRPARLSQTTGKVSSGFFTFIEGPRISAPRNIGLSPALLFLFGGRLVPESAELSGSEREAFMGEEAKVE